MEIVWKIEIKSAKLVKSLEIFLSKLLQVLYKRIIFFVLVKSYSILHARLQHTIKKALFLRLFT